MCVCVSQAQEQSVDKQLSVILSEVERVHGAIQVNTHTHTLLSEVERVHGAIQVGPNMHTCAVSAWANTLCPQAKMENSATKTVLRPLIVCVCMYVCVCVCNVHRQH